MSKHCWHTPNPGFMRGDGATQVVCCNCGADAFTVRMSSRIEGHGAHHPNPIREVWSAPDTECTPAAKEGET